MNAQRYSMPNRGSFVVRKNDKKLWVPEEDRKLLELVAEYGRDANWSTVAARLSGRTGKQCRERFLNHLDPTIKKGDWSRKEDETIISLHAVIGNRWCKFTEHLPGRTDCAIKNRYHVLIRKSMSHTGVSPAREVQGPSSSDSNYSHREVSARPRPQFGPGPSARESNSRESSAANNPPAPSNPAARHVARVEDDNCQSDSTHPSSSRLSKDDGGFQPSLSMSEPLLIEIPPVGTSSNNDTAVDQEMLDLCTSPGLGNVAADPAHPTNANSKWLSQMNMHQAALLSMQSPNADPMAGRSSLLHTNSLDMQLRDFSPSRMNRSYALPSNSPAAPSSLSSSGWYTFSPSAFSSMFAQPLTPMICAYEPQSYAPRTKKQKLLQFGSPRDQHSSPPNMDLG